MAYVADAVTLSSLPEGGDKIMIPFQFGTTQYRPNAMLHYSAALCGKVALYGNLQLQNMATFSKK
jgi:hypothetical protein